MKKLIQLVLLFTVINSPAVMAESMKIETIPMQNRQVEDVIPILKPLVVEGGTVTGINNKLIVKTTPSNLKQIKQVLAQIDNAPRRLMISVKQDVDGSLNVKESGVSGRYSTGDVTIASPDTGRGGTIIQGKDSDGNVVRYRQLETRSRLEDRNVFRVQALEGNPAYISTGQSVPIPNQTTFVTGGGVVVQDGVEYRDVESGFYVLPRIQGDNVTLLISPKLSRISPNQAAIFDIQNVETTVSGRLGEWIPVGGATQHFNDSSKRNLISTKRRSQEQRNVLVKVEEIK
ncbi:MAG: type II secretory pathway component GspD/PulD (secretin) [Gammaproteobacteria bacterium]